MALYSKPRAENDAPSPKQEKQGTRCQDRQNGSGTSQPQATSHATLAMRDSLKLPVGCLETEGLREIFRCYYGQDRIFHCHTDLVPTVREMVTAELKKWLSRMEFYKTPLPPVVEISCYLYWVLDVVVRTKI
ncbi:hypothetical protein CIRG_00910 [Coccidioides immitis RMSCC 2394]|uniref:Uncharacterized protein n=1 Tax=Coccidioides immitis RMSCC 2394 TaxID=404692 RepID=A0A0J6Y2D8_COCIT|nr:hypothetical protein CIRG_00910 [Coccidioides immitis RMSCC 2394]